MRGWSVPLVLSLLVVLSGCATPASKSSSSTSATHATGSSTTAADTTTAAPAGNVTLTKANHPPVITRFAANLSAGLSVRFFVNATDADNGTKLHFTLTFGDGRNLTGALPATNVTHAYATNGTFKARLVVSDGQASVNRTLALNVTAGGAPFTQAGSIMAGGVENVCLKVAGAPSLWGTPGGFDQFEVTLPPAVAGRAFTVTFAAGEGEIVGSAITFWKGGSSNGGSVADLSDTLAGTVPAGSDNAQMGVCGPAADITVTFTVA